MGRYTARLYQAHQLSLPPGTSLDHGQSCHGRHAASRSEKKKQPEIEDRPEVEKKQQLDTGI